MPEAGGVQLVCGPLDAFVFDNVFLLASLNWITLAARLPSEACLLCAFVALQLHIASLSGHRCGA